MIKYEFSKVGIEKMYQDTCNECFEALTNDTIDEINIEIKIGNQVMSVPVNADYMEDVFSMLKEWENE